MKCSHRRLRAGVAVVMTVSLTSVACGDDGRAARETQERRAGQVRTYARLAGQSIMDAIGGGQDLVVASGAWSFDEAAAEFDIPLEVSFNGSVVRGNNYRVTGVLTIGEDGSNPRFARLNASENYLAWENALTGARVGALIAQALERSK